MDTARASSPRVGWLLAATPEARGVTFVVVTVLLFGYFSIPSLLFEPDMASRLIARTSVMAIPPVLIRFWGHIEHAADTALAAGAAQRT